MPWYVGQQATSGHVRIAVVRAALVHGCEEGRERLVCVDGWHRAYSSGWWAYARRTHFTYYVSCCSPAPAALARDAALSRPSLAARRPMALPKAGKVQGSRVLELPNVIGDVYMRCWVQQLFAVAASKL